GGGAGLGPFVPRVTLTLAALASTREMLFLVTGEDKRDILRRVLGGEDFPASRVRPVGELVWLVDRAAAPEDHHAVSFDQEGSRRPGSDGGRPLRKEHDCLDARPPTALDLRGRRLVPSADQH